MTNNMTVSEGTNKDWNEFWAGDHIIFGGAGADTINLGAAHLLMNLWWCWYRHHLIQSKWHHCK